MSGLRRASTAAIAALVTLQLVCCLVSAQTTSDPASTYAIDFTQASSSSNAQVPLQDLSTCECDLTAGQCDVNCCCDSDCSAAEKSLMSVCLSAGANVTKAFTCVDVDALVATNGVQTTTLDRQLCVVSTTNPSLGVYYSDPGLVTSSSIFTSQLSRSPYTFQEPAATTSFGSKYTSGTPIRTSYNIASKAYTGQMTLPTPKFDGSCTQSPVNFQQDVGDGLDTLTCTRGATAASMLANCGNDLWSTQKLVSGFSVAAQPQSTSTVSVSAGTLTCRSATGQDSACAFTALPATALTTDPATNNTVCSNIVRAVHYRFSYTSAGLISSVAADLVLQDYVINGSSVASLAQVSSASFTVAGANAASVRFRSGNPGYLKGLPLLAGELKTDSASGKTAIALTNVRGDGLRILGTVASTATGPSCQSHATVVGFGQDVESTCTLALSLNDFAGGCAAVRAKARAVFAGNRTYTHVAKWGNATYLDVGEWLPIGDSTIPAIPGSSVDPDGVCSGVLTGMHYEFLYARLGARGDPQNRIVGARVVYTTEDIRYTCTGLACQVASTTQATLTNPFQLQSTVRFVLLPEQALTEVVPPAPPVLPTLPDDIFYPFTIGIESNSAGSSAADASGVLQAASDADGSQLGSAATGTSPTAPQAVANTGASTISPSPASTTHPSLVTLVLLLALLTWIMA